ncbi:TIR domain-containing protein [uncultured Kriegella sp.]|uniref:TIR domain-containing protein n=1 Tax=uncultured Kriegella sp. TaxID=1798910 RepID=UPI0030D873A8|tara:strand:- start:22384 stop:23946 length:1563 start_codon:yes stop_codon:yes gene_type:complete
MTTLKRLAVYLFIFVLLLSIAATLTNFWQSLDYYVYRTFYLDRSEQIEMSTGIHLIDLPHHAENKTNYDRSNYRKRLSNLLDTIAAAKGTPRAVLLDIYFENEPQELETLKKALKNIGEKTKVYGVYDMREYEQITFEENEGSQAVDIYENYLEGFRLHSMFEEKMGILFYESELPFPREAGGYELIEAVASKVARDVKLENTPTLESRSYVLPLGNTQSVKRQTVQFLHASDRTTGGSFSSSFDIDDKILIIGSLTADRIAKINKTGTHLVAWALMDQINNNTLAKQPLTQPYVYIGLVLFFAIFTALLFALFFKYLKKLQTKPLIIAVLSFLTSAALLLCVGAAILSFGQVIPMGLPLITILLSAVLSWRFAYKFLVTGIAEGAQKYDVFISYSRGNSDWVIKNVYEPLTAFRKPNGDKLNIFFDRDSIGIGEAFTAKYMWAIVDSQVFIPVFSEEYYGKNHCSNEMDLAYKRSVEKLITILPVAFSYESVPQIYTHINFLDITVNPNFIKDIEKALE